MSKRSALTLVSALLGLAVVPLAGCPPGGGAGRFELLVVNGTEREISEFYFYDFGGDAYVPLIDEWIPAYESRRIVVSLADIVDTDRLFVTAARAGDDPMVQRAIPLPPFAAGDEVVFGVVLIGPLLHVFESPVSTE